MKWPSKIYIQVVKLFILSLFLQSWSHLLITRENGNMDISPLIVQEKVQFESCYVHTQPKPTVGVTSTLYSKTPVVRTTFLKGVENCNNLGNVENKTGRGRPPFSEQMVRKVNFLLLPARKKGLKESCCVLWDFLLHRTSHSKEASLHVSVQNKQEYINYNNKCMLDELYFLNRAWRIYHPVPVSYVRLLFW